MASTDIRELTFEHVLETILKPAGVKVGGFPDDIFIDLTEKEKEEFLCNICFRIVNDCHQCANHHKFCVTCIFAWSLTFGENSQLCPVCRNPQTSYEKCEDAIIKLQNRLVKCDDDGCDFRAPLRYFLMHSHGKSKYNNNNIDLESLRPPQIGGRHIFIFRPDGSDSQRGRMVDLRGQLSQGRLMIQQMMMLLHLEMQLRQQAVASSTRAELRIQQMDEVLALNEQLTEVGTILSLLLDTPLSEVRRAQAQNGTSLGPTASSSENSTSSSNRRPVGGASSTTTNHISDSSTSSAFTYLHRRVDSPYVFHRNSNWDEFADDEDDDDEDVEDSESFIPIWRRSQARGSMSNSDNRNSQGVAATATANSANGNALSVSQLSTGERNTTGRILAGRSQQDANMLLSPRNESLRSSESDQVSLLAFGQQRESNSFGNTESRSLAQDSVPIRPSGVITTPLTRTRPLLLPEIDSLSATSSSSTSGLRQPGFATRQVSGNGAGETSISRQRLSSMNVSRQLDEHQQSSNAADRDQRGSAAVPSQSVQGTSGSASSTGTVVAGMLQTARVQPATLLTPSGVTTRQATASLTETSDAIAIRDANALGQRNSSRGGQLPNSAIRSLTLSSGSFAQTEQVAAGRSSTEASSLQAYSNTPRNNVRTRLQAESLSVRTGAVAPSVTTRGLPNNTATRKVVGPSSKTSEQSLSTRKREDGAHQGTLMRPVAGATSRMTTNAGAGQSAAAVTQTRFGTLIRGPASNVEQRNRSLVVSNGTNASVTTDRRLRMTSTTSSFNGVSNRVGASRQQTTAKAEDVPRPRRRSEIKQELLKATRPSHDES